MDTPNLSILIVDDTKFSSAIVSKTLANAGYQDLRSAKSAFEALELIKERPIDILLADWMMPEMDGLELTQKIRELDQVSGLYTYITLLTAKEGTDHFATAFDAGVDDFINKAAMKEQLVPRVMAASRLVVRQNKLLKQNRELLVAKHKLEILNTVDSLTKIGNRKYACTRIQDVLSFVESRGGALCYLHFSIVDVEQLQKQYRKAVIDQIVISVAKRIQQLVRPMDGVTRVGKYEFGVIQHQNSLDVCQGKIFKRILDGVNRKAYETEAGFISLKIAISLVGLDNRQEFFPSADTIIEAAQNNINVKDADFEVSTFHWSAANAH